MRIARSPVTVIALVAASALVAIVLLVPSSASGLQQRSSGTLQVNARFTLAWHGVQCAAGTPVTTGCFLVQGTGLVPGLGRASLTSTVLDDQTNPTCHHFDFPPTVVDVAGKGTIDVALVDPKTTCFNAPHVSGTFAATVSGGSGAYAGASGAGGMDLQLVGSETGVGTATWTGTLTVPGLEFDTTPPVLRGIQNKVVKTRRGAKRAVVRYSVTAQDAVEGPVPAICRPASGSRFKVGKTAVSCGATDSSGNVASGRFVVTVRKV